MTNCDHFRSVQSWGCRTGVFNHQRYICRMRRCNFFGGNKAGELRITVGHNSHVLFIKLVSSIGPKIPIATSSSGPAAGNSWALRFCFISNPFWPHKRHSFIVVWTSFGKCGQKKWCFIVSYIRHSIWCTANVRLWERYSTHVNDATEKNFWSATYTGACPTKKSLQS